MKEIALIVIYNKQIEDSSTLNSLIHSNYSGDLYIFNNGPNLINASSSFLGFLQSKYNYIEIVEDVKNRPLSAIYNNFLNVDGYDNYYLFDDDTMIPSNFFVSEQRMGYDLSLPIITSSRTGDTVYPIVNKKVIAEANISLHECDEVLSIGSGLMINKSLIQKFKGVGIKPFDERFALYGVDYSLFRRLPYLKGAGYTVNIGVAGILHHSLSSEDGSVSDFRKRERLIDLVLTKLHYSRRKFPLQLLSILKTLTQQAIKKEFRNLKVLLGVCLYQEHPRSTQYKNRLKNNNNNKA